MGDSFLPVPGVRLGVAGAAIKHPDRDDLLVIELPEGASCAAVFTRNAFRAAPVLLAERHLRAAAPRYLLINSGNANAGTGEQGLRDGLSCCQTLADLGGCQLEQVLPFSTGVIGENLPLERVQQALPEAFADLDEAAWPAAAQAIMTTDTVPKLVSRQTEIDGIGVRVTGIAKGAGMIRPDMATMLGFLATDLAVEPGLLQTCLEEAVGPSFNSITVDGDTSTNDSCVLMASARSVQVSNARSPLYLGLCELVNEVCMELARDIVRDGEGATKLVEIRVEAARSEAEARQVAYTIAHSPLVKTALFAADPNWGRILAAVGRAGVEGLEIEGVEIWLDQVCIVRDGGRYPEYTESAGSQVMERDEYTIRVLLGRGGASARVLTCDLSYDYVRINAEYRT